MHKARILFGGMVLTVGSLIVVSCSLRWLSKPAIAASEELLFRGYIQGRLRGLGPVPAVVLAAAAHGAYKVSLFLFLPEGVAVDLFSLGYNTFAAGLAAGAVREWSKSVVPPLAGHVLFDIVRYGERSVAPWWVWS
jgi:membrane protease YdiL (CAAX protease family)